MPTVAGDAMVASSHPLASAAGLEAFRAGGNAVDAALAAAVVLAFAEPTDNGLGGDAFALVWHGGRLHGLNGSGRAPAVIDELRVDETGPRSVTVPGAVRAWADLAAKFGRFGLDRALARGAELAARGVACTPRIAHKWAGAGATLFPVPAVGERFVLPDLAETLTLLATDGPEAFYRGRIAEAIASASWLDESDLASHSSEWVKPLRHRYRGVEVCELPPNGQGAAALIALGLYEGLEPGLHSQLESMKLALADVYAHVGDGPLPEALLDPSHLAARRALVEPTCALDPRPSVLPGGGTTYLCAVDADGTAISLIQSIFGTFGSGVVAPGTGIVLQNRAAGFVAQEAHPNRLAAGRRPFHTIIPGMLLEGGALLGPFGVMGGAMQPQGHVQVLLNLLEFGMDPQEAVDAARFRHLAGRRLAVERLDPRTRAQLEALGHELVEMTPSDFGGAQLVMRLERGWAAASDPRKDGMAAGH